MESVAVVLEPETAVLPSPIQETNCEEAHDHENDPTSQPRRSSFKSPGHRPGRVSIDIPPPRPYYKTQPDTPSNRTGPPRSLSFAYSLPSSPGASRGNSKHEPGDTVTGAVEDDENFPISATTDFRGALEYSDHHSPASKGKKREHRNPEDSWNPRRWFQESPKEEKSGFDLGSSSTGNVKKMWEGSNERNQRQFTNPKDGESSNPGVSRTGLRRAFSVPGSDNKTGRAKWNRLRALIPTVIHSGSNAHSVPEHSVVAPTSVNITDELITGGLSTLMLRLWFERDDKGHRRIPILFHRLRIRVSDSLHPLSGHKSVFRIECEYANGAARWVVYRELRDFVSLHTHYTVANVYNRNADKLPEFPRTSIPYFKFLNKEGREKGKSVGQADFARLQRESLEDYLINLIRAVMFHPSTNRLAGFLEVSALSISLAQSGGAQYKAGILQIECAKGGTGFGRKSASWREKMEARWCAVRESYLVVLQEPGELTVCDVFLLDPDFRIERPKRYLRQGLNLLHPDSHNTTNNEYLAASAQEKLHAHSDSERRSIVGSIRSRVSKVFRSERGRPGGTSGGAHPSEYAPSSASSRASSESMPSRPPTPMLDPSTNANPLDPNSSRLKDEKFLTDKKKRASDVSKHTFYIMNSQMRLKLFARNERQMLQWITALEKVASTSHYTGTNRFDSFAPIRSNVAAQWLVDGRDYFWNLSRAILLARESIYIHDWWLSPELHMRRPGKERYRLDRLLERKAKEGVKIYVILYQEVSNRTTPTDSNYTKQRLTSLHPNVMVQRSPSHFQTGTFYWAHHEKLCVIDQTIAFMGGLDLCFGRWDTPQHVLVDDTEDTNRPEIWPGKDYSNPRLSDFYNLNKPEEDMYDRTKVPRMPWHDVAMQVVGQPARDLSRHFVERWNYLLRIKNHSKTMPFLLPPPEFRPGELTQLGLTGTCEMQICRSAGPWSMGTPNRIELSIQNAYLKAIQMSEHFVYIENQFFITATVVNDVRVENQIGDALVRRIIRAHQERTPWRCCIVIPLLPGFTFPVDHSDASAIRIILECQSRTLTRGPHSIFSRLRKEGIDPDDYISVFSLRNWAKMRGDVLTTEQVYIHGKVCIVDDRLAIIGSANINERSQRGDRDSELAAVIRDTDLVDCTMAGKPFKVGRFAHTLRIRLMREHIGVDVDKLDEPDLMASDPVQAEHEQQPWDPDSEQMHGQEGVIHTKTSKEHTLASFALHSAGDGVDQAVFAAGQLGSKVLHKTGMGNAGHEKRAREIIGPDTGVEKQPGLEGTMLPTLEEKMLATEREELVEREIGESSTFGERQPTAAPSNDKVRAQVETERRSTDNEPPPAAHTPDRAADGDASRVSSSTATNSGRPRGYTRSNEIGEEEKATLRSQSSLPKAPASKINNKTWTVPTPKPTIDPQGFEDPIADAFWKDVWVASAVHNTEIYRKVFHAIPDDLISTWKQYKEFIVHHERLNKPSRENPSSEAVGRVPSEAGDDHALEQPESVLNRTGNTEHFSDENTQASRDDQENQESPPNTLNGAPNGGGSKVQKPAKGPEPFEKWEREEMEKLLGEVCGHLVVHPTRFLEGEDVANNFLFNADRLLPLPIYT